MKICDFTRPEIEMLMAECNFTKEENALFSDRAKGTTQEETAENMNVSISTAKRIEKKVWSKIDRILK